MGGRQYPSIVAETGIELYHKNRQISKKNSARSHFVPKAEKRPDELKAEIVERLDRMSPERLREILNFLDVPQVE